MIAVIARLAVKEGQEAEFESVMAELATQVRANEPGCKLYQLCKSNTSRQYTMIERYENQEALAAHAQTPYFRAGMGKLGPLLEGRAAIEVLSEVG